MTILIGTSEIRATKLALLQSKFHRTVKHHITQVLRPFKLSSVDWVILGFLDHKKTSVTITEVAVDLGIQSSFMATIVDKLEKRKLITVIGSETDKRKKNITVTKEGRQMVKKIQDQFGSFFSLLTKGLSKKDIVTYVKVLTTVIKNTK